MDQEEHAPANKRKKIEKDELNQESIVQNVDSNTVDKSVRSSEVDLTGDAWLLVFNRYLGIEDKTRIGRVCKKWRELARISWKGVTRLSFENMFKPPSELTNDILEFNLRHCTNLRYLDLSSARNRSLTPYTLDLVGLYSTSLQELNFSYIDISKHTLKTLAERLPRLQSLSLECCKGLRERGLRAVLKMLQSLKSLSVSGNKRITGGFFGQAPLSLVEVFAKNCYEPLSDRGVCLLAERCPNLETIDIGNCKVLTGQSITDLVDNCPKLKSFKVRLMNLEFQLEGRRRSNLATIYFLALPSKLPLLEVLHVDGHFSVTDEVFKELGRHCPLLRSISCSFCYSLTNAAIYHLSRCHHLESINLNGCRHITNRELIQLSSAHCNLKKVHLQHCHGITVEGVSHLLSAHPNLLELNISGCRQLTNMVLPILESSLLHRKIDRQPLKICLPNTVTIEEATEFAEKTKCILCCGCHFAVSF